ncbi:hypothetical protein FQN49_000155 [Arthroderma sp. PD_2]|nr:hypothetical protein FQN49_000155 [Arthroderma sp. PD_2]
MGKRDEAAAEWEPYKAEITRLRQSNKLPDLMAFMEKEYSFYRSAQQYNRQFVKWGLSKYSSQKDYEYMAHAEKKRKFENKDTEFNVRGKILKSEDLKKKLRRHLPKGFETVPLIEIGPLTPEGIQALTPPARNDGGVSIELADLPFFQFQQYLRQAIFLREPPLSHHFDFSAIPMDALIPTTRNKHDRYPNQFLQAVTIGQTEEELFRSSDAIIRGPPTDALFYTISYCAYLSSNNLLAEENLDNIVEWMATNERRLPQLDFLDPNSPTVAVFLRQLLERAVQLEYTILVSYLLQICLSSDDPSRILQSHSLLYIAFEYNELEMATHILDTGICLEDYQYRLDVIVREGYDEMLKLLISRGLNIRDQETYNKLSWLEAAVDSGQTSIVKLLIGQKVVDIDVSKGAFFRVLAQNDEIAQLLIHAGMPIPPWFEFESYEIREHLTRISVSKGYGLESLLHELAFFYPIQTPLEVAAQSRNWGLVRSLVGHGALLDLGDPWLSTGKWETWVAALGNRLDTASIIPVMSALQAAVRHGNIEMTLFLLRNGAKVDGRPQDMYGHTALQIAVATGNKAIVNLLLEWNANVNAGAGIFQDPNTNIYPDTYTDPDSDTNIFYKGATALQFAAGLEDLEIFILLLKKGADVRAEGGKDGKTVLQTAAHVGNLELVRFLLRNSYTDVHERPYPRGGRTALQAASESCSPSSLEIMRLLLFAGANSNEPPAAKRGITALQGAAAAGNVAKAELLLAANARVELCSAQYGCTALHKAIEGCHSDMVTLLLQNGATPCYDASAVSGRTPLQEACWHGDTHIASLLLSSIPCDLHSQLANIPASFNGGVTALQAAVRSRNLELVKLLLILGADPNAPGAVVSGKSALETARLFRDFEMLRLLLEEGARFPADWDLPFPGIGYSQQENISGYISPKTEGVSLKYPLPDSSLQLDNKRRYSDLKDRYGELMSLVVGSGFNITIFPRVWLEAALAFAIYIEDFHIVDVLIAGDVSLISASTCVNCTGLQWAAAVGNVETVKVFVKHGVDVNEREIGWCGWREISRSGGTALWLAAYHGRFEVVKYLLECGADIKSPTSGRSALQVAARNGHAEMVRHLVEVKDADINVPGCEAFKRTALQAAVEHGHIDIVSYLLEHGADINAPAYCDRGVTALQVAAITGHAGILSILLDAGADVTAPGATDLGRTAIEGAAEHGRLDILHMLLQIHPPGQHLADQLREAKKLADVYNRSEITRAIRGHQESQGWLE